MDTKLLKQKILDLSIRGKLVPQDPNDEPASVLLERIKAEKAQLIKEGKIKKEKALAPIEEVPFDLPKGWKCTRFGDYLDVRDGTHDSPKYVDKGYPFVTSKNLKNGNIDFTSINYITREDHINFSKRSCVQNGDILFAMIGSIGNPVIVQTDIEFSIKNVALFKPIHADTNMQFIKLFLEYVQHELQLQAKGGMQPFVPLNYFRKDLLIPIPPLEEQKRIVAEIDRWFKCIDELEKNQQDLHTAIQQAKSKILDLAIHGKLVPQDPNEEPAQESINNIKSSIIRPKKKKKSDFSDIEPLYDIPDTWTWCKLYDICPFLTRGKSPKYSDTDNMYPVFAQKCNLKEGGISLDKALFLDPSTLSKWGEEYHLKNGDILINSTGTGTVGRTRLFKESCLGKYPFVVPDSHVSVVRTAEEICSEYVFAFISSMIGQVYIESNLAGSTNQKELYIGVLENMDIPIPPFSEQKRIVSKIEELFAQLDKIEESLN